MPVKKTESQEEPVVAGSVFDTLSVVNVNDHTEKKNGLTYLSWAWAWAEVKKAYPPFEGKSPDTSEIPSMYAQMK